MKLEFRPRWVRLRKILIVLVVIYFAALTFVLFPYAIYLEQAWLGVVLTLAAILGGGFAFDPVKSSAMVGLLYRPFPSLAIKHAQFEDWLELDLDWDETRK